MKHYLYVAVTMIFMTNTLSGHASEVCHKAELSKIYLDPHDIHLKEDAIEVLINGHFVSIPQLNVDEKGIYLTIHANSPWYWACDAEGCKYLNNYDAWYCARCGKKRTVNY